MDVKILGTGCVKCQKLIELTEQAAREMGIEICIENVTDAELILSYSIVATPALVVNGEVIVAGRVPSLEDLIEMLS